MLPLLKPIAVHEKNKINYTLLLTLMGEDFWVIRVRGVAAIWAEEEC